MRTGTRYGRLARVGRSILWVLKTSLVSIVILGVITGLAWGGFLVFAEIQRSFDSIAVRVEANQSNLELLQSDVDALAEAGTSQREQLGSLRDKTAEQETQLTNITRQLDSGLQRQGELLAALQEQVDAAVGDQDKAAEDMAALGSALVALQRDVNQNSGRIDDLGGEVDALRAETETLGASVALVHEAAVTNAQSGVGDVQLTLALFRVWELTARASLRLVQNNVGLATADVEAAVRAMDELLLLVPETEVEPLQMVQARLALAFASLPDDPALAARDLETAWDELDGVLSARISPSATAKTATAASAAAADTITATPEATAQPTPSPTPTPASP
ncbi:MAG: hypothetical protein ACE5E7_01145 [Anaerolineae bacterium]